MVSASSRTGPHLGAPSAPRIPLRLTAKHLPAGLLRGLTDLKTGSLLAVCPGGREGAAVAADVRCHPGLALSSHSEPQPSARCGGLALVALRVPAGTQLSSLRRREEGGSMSPSPFCPCPGLNGWERPPRLSTNSFFPPFYVCGLPVPNARTKKTTKTLTTLSGGSLGSCVDEERS